jgi:hypothetical protein
VKLFITYAMLSSFLLFYHIWIQIISSALFSQTPQCISLP